ncbi:hypothetical protein [Spirosoma sp.]|uniref:hypothetical protein n=1 Tax=Spirosoma sp. TaxID=1899569 RepID=UPI003B3A00ED
MAKQFYLLLTINLITLTGFAQSKGLLKAIGKAHDKRPIAVSHSDEKCNEVVRYKRSKERGQVQFFLQLTVKGGTVIPQHGATVLFKDGASIEWVDAVVTSTSKGDELTSQCLIKLTEEDVEHFQEREIALIRLATQEHIFDKTQSLRAKSKINQIICADLLGIESDTVVCR